MRRPPRAPITRLFLAIIGLIAVLTALGLALLWPGGVDPAVGQVSGDTEAAEVEKVESFSCPPPQEGTCRTAEVRLESGPDTGTTQEIDLGAEGLTPEIEPGDSLRLNRTEIPASQPGSAGGAPDLPEAIYSVADFERRSPILWLALAFAALVIVFGRLRGALSLLGLALSLALILLFVVPAILDGKPPLAVAVVGASAVMLMTISLAHGLGAKSLAAMVGTSASLLLVALLALIFTELAHLTGFSSEEATLLAANQGAISIEGLLLAGMVIGALGVLDDVTVSQASTVIALRGADPDQSFLTLYRRALDVGRDHVSATVNTLVLAYVGASLPVLLIFTSNQIGLLDAVNSEVVANEIVAMLVGSIGLIAAVPITTAMAALLARKLPHDELSAAVEQGHNH